MLRGAIEAEQAYCYNERLDKVAMKVADRLKNIFNYIQDLTFSLNFPFKCIVRIEEKKWVEDMYSV